jgi:hypothetical protein
MKNAPESLGVRSLLVNERSLSPHPNPLPWGEGENRT